MSDDPEEVRGWRKTSSEWPVRGAQCQLERYYVQRKGEPGSVWDECGFHYEDRLTYENRGRPLTLAEVVDLIDPEKAPTVRQSAEPEPIACRECKVDFKAVGKRWHTFDSSGYLCAYCDHRIHGALIWHERVHVETGPGIEPTPVAEPYEDGDVYELPGSEWP